MGALDSGRFDHSKPSFVGIGHDDDLIAHVGAEEDDRKNEDATTRATHT